VNDCLPVLPHRRFRHLLVERTTPGPRFPLPLKDYRKTFSDDPILPRVNVGRTSPASSSFFPPPSASAAPTEDRSCIFKFSPYQEKWLTAGRKSSLVLSPSWESFRPEMNERFARPGAFIPWQT